MSIYIQHHSKVPWVADVAGGYQLAVAQGIKITDGDGILVAVAFGKYNAELLAQTPTLLAENAALRAALEDAGETLSYVISSYDTGTFDASVIAHAKLGRTKARAALAQAGRA